MYDWSHKKKNYRLKDRQKHELLEKLSGNFTERLNSEMDWFETFKTQKNYISLYFGRKQPLYNYADNKYWELYEFEMDILIEDLEEINDESL